ncbi:ABC transporter permease [Terracidiphilus gabretensis]|uniref:ABC transporter permease n=1 Tax=Terracidiphilus gabretensis TaxID=1577687 RepID=UPI0009E96F9D|nr:ABC transporter permease [Terracidiphilus gabretensis]
MSWLGRFFAHERLETELDKEVRFHFESQVADKVRVGVSENEARRLTRLEFGGMEQVKEDCREKRGTMWLETIGRDVRYALRRLRGAPVFSCMVVLTLALGLGANTAIFTLVHAILLRSLPVTDPSRLYRIGDQMHCCYFGSFESNDGDFDLFSYDLFRQFQQASPEFEQLAAVQAGGGSYTVRWGDSPAKSLRTEYVSGNYFTTFGVNTFAGRPLSPGDDTKGAAPVVVLSYSAWQREFDGNPNVIGATLHLDQHAFVVVGVAPPGFYGDRVAPFPPDMWMPLASEPVMEGANSSLLQPDTAWLYAIGRMRPDVNLGVLQTKLSGVLRQWMGTLSTFTARGGAAEIPRQHVVLSPAGGGIQKVQQQTGTGLRILLFLSSVVLLIACANIANLLLARSMAQRAEIAVRIGLGATRGRIIQQILMESLILSVIGGVVGLGVAYFGSRAILALAFPLSRNMPVSADPSWVVLAFAFGTSILTGLLFAGVPAWVSSGTQPADAARGMNRSTRDHASIPQRLLLVFQVALSMVLIVCAFLATRSLYNLEHQRTGIETANRYTVQIDLNGPGYTSDRLNGIYREIEDHFSALPGMTAVSFARYLPLENNIWGSCVLLQGHPAPGPKDDCFSNWNRVSTNFLQSIGVPVLRGRGFSQDDETSAVPVVIVNQAFVKHFFAGKDALGQRFGVNDLEFSSAFQIVGVFADFKLEDAHGDVRPLFLRPRGQQYMGYNAPDQQAAEVSSLYLTRMVLQFDRPQQDVEQLVRSTIAKVDPNIPVVRVLSYPAMVANNFNQDRLLARLTEAFGILALLLASVGLYGVISYSAVRRTSEIGIRMALGASRSMIVSLMLRSAFVQFFAGLVIGVPAALFASRMMQHLLYEISSDDPWAFVGSVAVLGVCAAVAALIPAMRAASVDPIRALRTE